MYILGVTFLLHFIEFKITATNYFSDCETRDTEPMLQPCNNNDRTRYTRKLDIQTLCACHFGRNTQSN